MKQGPLGKPQSFCEIRSAIMTAHNVWLDSIEYISYGHLPSILAALPTCDWTLAPTWAPWYESPFRDCTLMNKSPEFMLKEPAEPESKREWERERVTDTGIDKDKKHSHATVRLQ